MNKIKLQFHSRRLQTLQRKLPMPSDTYVSPDNLRDAASRLEKQSTFNWGMWGKCLLFNFPECSRATTKTGLPSATDSTSTSSCTINNNNKAITRWLQWHKMEDHNYSNNNNNTLFTVAEGTTVTTSTALHNNSKATWTSPKTTATTPRDTATPTIASGRPPCSNNSSSSNRRRILELGNSYRKPRRRKFLRNRMVK